jgi:malate dehydrogenase (oxaloacetate-decarboxylating)(NADP+)
VFHDDQHGTAIVVGAAILNGLDVVGKRLDEVKVVCSGAGAAALACLDLLVSLGIPQWNIWVADIAGVVHSGRTVEMDDNKARYMQPTDARTLSDLLPGADVFLGLSAARVLKPEWLARMAARPLILALANPEPEIMPDLARAARPDAIIATGRSDYPNQVNNVLVFPFIFRGALDVAARRINEPMKVAAVRALAELAKAEQSDIVAQAYGIHNLHFGADYLIPKPFDPRLIVTIAPAVAQAAMDSGVAGRPIADFAAYRERLTHFVYASGLLMKPVFQAAKKAPKRIVFAEGEDERVLRAVQVVLDEELARPILIGRPAVLAKRIERYGLRIRPGEDFEVINPESDPRYREYWSEYYRLTQRKGISQSYAKIEMRRRQTLIGAMAIHRGDADGMLCGTFGTHGLHLHFIDQVLGLRQGVKNYAAMNAVVLPEYTVFIADTYVNVDPTADEIAEITLLAAEGVRRFGLTPKVALLSHSSFGSSDHPQAKKMQQALRRINELAPELEVEGEMHGDAALSEEVRVAAFPNSRLKGEANLLIMPTIDAANISFNLMKVSGGGNVTLGPILLGVSRPVHILTPSATVRRIVNMTALTTVDAQFEQVPRVKA